ncbi:MAG TPA: DUF2520 domain-containing protein [Pseudobacteroides sp.]|uniref:Rossmann-like and DUF2520 domain-containing protein n=1 Tax=Pseudobacteroides sp. TaxID=1968840 RepID=UPI002F95C9A5
MNSKSIGIIGTGKLGSSLAVALQSKGFILSGLYSIGGVSQNKLCNSLGVCVENDLKKTVARSDIIFITVPDSQIKNAAIHISQSTEADSLKNKCFFHMSGALTSDELVDLGTGVYTGSLHPIQTFADAANDPKIFEGIYFGFEGCGEAYLAAKYLVDALNGKIINIQKANKPIYHACACIISNYTVTLSYTVEKLLRVMDVENQIGINAFLPLLKGTVANIEKFGSIMSLTGPISRGDLNVIKRHIEALNKKSGCLENELYRVMALATADVACEKGSIDEGIRLSINKLFDK